jgi:hypothetical protein
MNKMQLISAAALLCLSSSVALAAPVASSQRAAQPMVRQSLAAVLYDQNDNDSGSNVTSQNFESIYDAYDTQSADDFTVPAGVKWKLTEVDVTGAYSVAGPVSSMHVTIYMASKKGQPKKVVADFPEVFGTDNGTGSFELPLPSKVTLKPGTYWVSVQANMDFDVGGQWFWQNRSVVSGMGALWQNPGDGFGTGCVSYADESACLGTGVGDKMFTLRGKVKVIAP